MLRVAVTTRSGRQEDGAERRYIFDVRTALTWIVPPESQVLASFRHLLGWVHRTRGGGHGVWPLVSSMHHSVSGLVVTIDLIRIGRLCRNVTKKDSSAPPLELPWLQVTNYSTCLPPRAFEYSETPCGFKLATDAKWLDKSLQSRMWHMLVTYVGGTVSCIQNGALGKVPQAMEVSPLSASHGTDTLPRDSAARLQRRQSRWIKHILHTEPIRQVFQNYLSTTRRSLTKRLVLTEGLQLLARLIAVFFQILPHIVRSS